MNLTIGWDASRVVFSQSIDKMDFSLYTKAKKETVFILDRLVLVIDEKKLFKFVFPRTNKIASYNLGPFTIEINGGDWPSYNWKAQNLEYINTVIEEIVKEKIYVESYSNMFGEIFESLRRYAEHKISFYAKNWNKEIPVFCVLSALGLTPIAPLIIDDKIEEIYLDRPGSLCYIDHAEFGRLWYPYIVTRLCLKRLGFYAQLSSSGTLSLSTNTIKAHIVTDFFHLRVNVDSEPLAFDGGSCIIRKFNFTRMNLYNLIERGTLTKECAALLIGLINAGYNLFVCGLPRSGKTTLCNALLQFVNKEWRKVYIEDVVETSTPLPQDKVVRFSTESSYNTDKLFEVTKTLHRSPDLVFVGELQTREQTLAAATLLNIGIPSIQTVHSKTVEGLLKRWREIYGLKEAGSIFYACFMERFNNQRLVDRVEQILVQNEQVHVTTLYKQGEIHYDVIKALGLEKVFQDGLKALIL
jgi:type IV secretory pathway ATPase VirB11/archaellum biosynthesis ATPase